MEHFDDGKAATSDEHNGEESKLAKHTTMLETAKVECVQLKLHCTTY